MLWPICSARTWRTSGYATRRPALALLCGSFRIPLLSLPPRSSADRSRAGAVQGLCGARALGFASPQVPSKGAFATGPLPESRGARPRAPARSLSQERLAWASGEKSVPAGTPEGHPPKPPWRDPGAATRTPWRIRMEALIPSCGPDHGGRFRDRESQRRWLAERPDYACAACSAGVSRG